MSDSKENKITDIKNTHVPDKVYAFMIQSHHMLYELVDCNKGDVVSVEVFDDVGVEHEDGSREAIQLKSALSKRNPVSNKAIDLWKTLYNWMISIESKELDLDTVKLILFINVDKSGEVVNAFDKAKTLEEAESAWKETKKIFYNEKSKEVEIGDGCKEYIEYFYDDNNFALACNVIKQFKLKKCVDDYSKTVRKKFDNTNFPDDIIDAIYKAIIGWIDMKVIKLVESGQAIIISFEEYSRQLSALYRDYNQKFSLMSFSSEPSKQEIENELNGERLYIDQLDIIDCDYSEKIQAINDYLRAASNRTIWANNGDVSHQSLDAYEERLKRSWDRKKRMVAIERRGDSPELQGRMTYYKCVDEKIDMETKSVPDFYQSGCYHALADDLIVGWHPDYLEHLGKKEGKKNGKAE